ncbi:hypothetical protein ACWCQD_27400, partial [Streptomyces atratus]
LRDVAELDPGEWGGPSPGRRAVASSSVPAVALLEAENAALRRENTELRKEREILRKAARYFASETGW